MLYQEKGVKACETHWHVEPGWEQGVTHLSNIIGHIGEPSPNIASSTLTELMDSSALPSGISPSSYHFLHELLPLTLLLSIQG